MKKNGFISISIIFTFFVVFLLLLFIILNSYTHNRNRLDILKTSIKQELADLSKEKENNLEKEEYLNVTKTSFIYDSLNNSWISTNHNDDSIGTITFSVDSNKKYKLCYFTSSEDRDILNIKVNNELVVDNISGKISPTCIVLEKKDNMNFEVTYQKDSSISNNDDNAGFYLIKED